MTKHNGFLRRPEAWAHASPAGSLDDFPMNGGRVSVPSTHLPDEGGVRKWRSDICVFIKFVVWGNLYKNKRGMMR